MTEIFRHTPIRMLYHQQNAPMRLEKSLSKSLGYSMPPGLGKRKIQKKKWRGMSDAIIREGRV